MLCFKNCCQGLQRPIWKRNKRLVSAYALAFFLGNLDRWDIVQMSLLEIAVLVSELLLQTTQGCGNFPCNVCWWTCRTFRAAKLRSRMTRLQWSRLRACLKSLSTVLQEKIFARTQCRRLCVITGTRWCFYISGMWALKSPSSIILIVCFLNFNSPSCCRSIDLWS